LLRNTARKCNSINEDGLTIRTNIVGKNVGAYDKRRGHDVSQHEKAMPKFMCCAPNQKFMSRTDN
jgi:hypothetical protein